MYQGNNNFSSIIKYFANKNPKKVVITHNNNHITYAEMQQRVSALAQGLLKLGVEKNDVVAVLTYNCPQFLEIMFATNRIGAIFLPLNYRLVADDFQYILNNAGAKIIFTETEFKGFMEQLKPRLPKLDYCILLSESVDNEWLSYNYLINHNLGIDIPDVHVDLSDLHRLMYTSGTTSRPKGVKISYENLYWKNIGHVWEFDITPDDKSLIVGPLYHVGGLDLTGTATLYRGGSVVILRRFDPEMFLKAVENEKPTNTWMAPAMINMLLQHPDRSNYDLGSIRYIIAGGERMPEPLVSQVLSLFRNSRFSDAYGMTETVSGDTFMDRENTLKKLGSVGKPVIHLDIKIVGENGDELPPGEVGEIVLRGPKVSKGYWNNEEATAQSIKNGWLHSGDVGYLDEDGYLYIVDRKKDLIISGGENIASLEVERVLYQHPNVLEAAVIGIPHSKWGEVPKAFVALKDNVTTTPEDIKHFCQGKIAKFKVPNEVEIIDRLPRNPSGKVLKRALREGVLRN